MDNKRIMKLENYPLLRCLALYRQMPYRFLATALLFLAANIALVSQQWLIGQAVQTVQQGQLVVKQLDGQLNMTQAYYYLAIITAVALIRAIFQYGAGLFALIIGQDLLFIIRERILIQVQALDLSYHREHGIGGMISRTTRDADKLRDALINFWRQIFETSLVIIVSVALLIWYQPLLGIVVLLITVLGIYLLSSQSEGLVVLDRAVSQSYDAVNEHLNESVNGIRVIKAFGLEDQRIDLFKRYIENFINHAQKALGYANTHIPIPQTIIALAHIWVLVFGAYLVSIHQLNIGQFVAALLIVNTMILRVEGIGRIIQIFADARASAERIWQLLDAQPHIQEGQMQLGKQAIALKVQHLYVKPEGHHQAILKDCSFSSKAGDIIAIVGATGSGKSTLMAVLPRLIDYQQGQIELGIDGQWYDLKQFSSASIRQQIHVVSQESFLFSDTLAANLRQACTNASDEQLIAALKQAAADEILLRLENGLETRLGDKGINLSGGQRQRLCLARAFLANPSILVLDDATSALDANTEKTILDNLRQHQQHTEQPMTTLIVSSKLSTVLLADHILLLADGQIRAQGTHSQLVNHSPAYRELMGIDT